MSKKEATFLEKTILLSFYVQNTTTHYCSHISAAYYKNTYTYKTVNKKLFSLMISPFVITIVLYSGCVLFAVNKPLTIL